MKPQVGQSAFILESGHIIRRVIITRVTRDLCTVQFPDTQGQIRVRPSRLYFNYAEAQLQSELYVRQAQGEGRLF